MDNENGKNGNIDTVCGNCGLPTPSVGLEFVLNADKTHYIVKGIGSCKDTDVVIPDTYENLPVTGIYNSAFFNCEKLTNIVIPDSIVKIGILAFYGCKSLTSIVIPAGVTEIGKYAFRDCTSLESITVNEDNTAYKSIDGNLYTKDGKALIRYATRKEDTSFTIPNSVIEIGKYAFSDCERLTSIVIPDSVAKIGSYAFCGCENISSIEIPNSTTEIGEYAFEGCKNLTRIVIPASVTEIGEYAFRDCTKLKSITVIEDNTAYKSIDGNLYTKDGKTLIQYAIGKKDTSFTIPNSVTKIEGFAFYCCEELASILIPNSVTEIGEAAFFCCEKLTSLIIPNNVTEIGKAAFQQCASLTSIAIPNSVTEIDDWAFFSCDNLASVVIPDSVIKFGEYAFCFCEKLTTINYRGNEKQWNSISKSSDWDNYTGNYTITYNYTGE